MKTTFDLLLNEEEGVSVATGSTPPVEVSNDYTPAGVIGQTGGIKQAPEINIIGETYTDGGVRYIPTTDEPLTNIKDLPENGDVKYPREEFMLYNTKDDKPVYLTEIEFGVFKIKDYPGTWKQEDKGIDGGSATYINENGDILKLYAKTPTAGGGTTPPTPEVGGGTVKSVIEEGSNLIKNNKKTAIIIIAVVALIVLGSFLKK